MTKRHPKPSRDENTADSAKYGAAMSHPKNPAKMQMFFLAVTVLCEIGWVVFLAVLAITK